MALLCDSGDRYAHSYYAPDWYARHGIDIEAADARWARALRSEPLSDLPTAGTF